MKKGVRRMRASTLALLKFLRKHFGDHKPFKWDDVVKAGWGGRRWSLAKLRGEYLRRSRKVKGAYTYARGVSNGAKYGQVVRRKSRKVTALPSVSARRKTNLSLQESDLLNAMEAIDQKIEDLTAAKEELNRAYMAVEALPNISELLAKTKKVLEK